MVLFFVSMVRELVLKKSRSGRTSGHHENSDKGSLPFSSVGDQGQQDGKDGPTAHLFKDSSDHLTPSELKRWKESKRSEVRGEAAFADAQAEIIKRHLVSHYKHLYDKEHLRHTAVDIIAASPLLASLIAPLSTLYDIPGFSQRWYTLNGVGQPDPIANSALSALGLAFNVIANGLLVLRFSSRREWWKTTMYISTACWIIKTIIAVTNIAVYANKQAIHPGYSYTEGFWCAVFSAILAGCISIMLCPYAIYVTFYNPEDNKSVRVQGRHFMLSELALFIFIAFEALVIYRIEGWEYFDTIYFCIVSAITVGFGDFAPTRTASMILMFPFALITIAGLATQVSIIISFFSSHSQERKDRWRRLYEKRQATALSQIHPSDELISEMEFLERLVKNENAISNLYDLGLSLLSFFTFWFLGAMAFYFIEGWSYGISLYFCYVFFLTLGYGDYTPQTPAGRVFFVTYSLIAVPIIASFAVQTVSNILTAVNESRLQRQKILRGLEPSVERATRIPLSESHREDSACDERESIRPFISHAELVVKGHERFHRRFDLGITCSDAPNCQNSDQKSKTNTSPKVKFDDDTNIAVTTTEVATDGMAASDRLDEEGVQGEKTAGSEGTAAGPPMKDEDLDAEEQEDLDKQKETLDELLDCAMRLEEQARKIMIANFAPGSRSRILLQADKNVMERSVSAFSGDASSDVVSQMLIPLGPINELEEIHIYRETFARLLVAGSRLKQLQGREQLLFERRRGRPFHKGYPVEDWQEECK